ncbi:MAG: hypothetical protein CMJ33_08075 [Phycisphaerae bacterium]|nr:hypothetical protein [Phycisphaerae bacterium]HAW95902.1 hypothetical protein [Phycisphaerales bacterium]|tara:strand:+ start:612 stop:1412 length:801 start_codon:yes stop_codon:yes gene_type:complete
MTTAQFNYGFIQASEDGMIALNLSQKNWIIGQGAHLEEDLDWRINTSTDEETMFSHHMVAELRKKLEKLNEDPDLVELVQRTSRNHGELLIMTPQDARLRQEVFGMAAETFEKKLGANLRSFTSMKIYVNQQPSESRFCVRKFKGQNRIQVIVNLSEMAYRFFRFHGRDHEDIDIDSMMPRGWKDEPEARFKQVCSEVRMLDMNYFRRIKEACDEGTVYLLLPLGPQRRVATMKAFKEILGKIPGGAIDLETAVVRRIYPGAGRIG